MIAQPKRKLHSPQITEKLGGVGLVTANQPLPEGWVEEHVRPVFASVQEPRQHRHSIAKLVPGDVARCVPSVDCHEDGLQGQRVQRREAHS